MSNAVYPAFSGQAWPVSRELQFKTLRYESASGRRVTLAKMFYPLRRITLKYAYLSPDDYETMRAFYMARLGAADDFLFDDIDDNTVTSPQVVGLGNGTNKQFQCVRNLGGFVEPVYAVKPGAVVRVNGVTVSGWAINDTGLLTLATAPANGHSVDWTGGFYYRVRFDRDLMEFEEFMQDFFEAKKVELVSFKP